jgi:hypothetical protein
LQGGWVSQLFNTYFTRFIGIAGEGGVDDNPLTVGHNQQRWVFQLQGIVGKLLQSGIKIAPRFLIFPAETTPFPDIGPAVAAAGLFGTSLKAVVIGVARLINLQQFAQVIKMSLLTATLGKGVVFSEGYELFRCHGVLYS